MTQAIKAIAVVQEGGRILIDAPELISGSSVAVIVLIQNGKNKRSIDEILAGYPGST